MKRNNLASTSSIHLGSLSQLVGATLAIAFFWGFGLVMAVIALIQLVVTKNVAESGAILLSAAAMFLIGTLCIPSVYYPLCRIFNWKAINILGGLHRFRPSLLIFLYPLILLLGYLVIKLPGVNWVILPTLNILAVGLPVLWILYITIRRLPTGSPQRLWGVFNSGLVLGPALILVFELTALLILVLTIAVAISDQPALVEQVLSFSERLSKNPLSPEQAIEMLAPILLRPEVILAVLAFASVAVPVIEEMIKPVGVWLLGTRKLTPAAGFAAGALSGAGYALSESLMLSVGGEAWITAMVGRAGTAVLHIATSSLMGWALVRAWNESRYTQLGLAYFGAVSIHGLWNALAVVTAYASLSSEIPVSFLSTEIVRWVEVILPACLIGIVAIIFCGLVWANHQLIHPPIPVTENAIIEESKTLPYALESKGGGSGDEDGLRE